MIERLVSEVKACLKADLQFAALTVALTLPDSCGKVYRPDCGNRERYTQWFNDYITKPQKEQFGIPDTESFWLNGEVVYSLRCAMLHESKPNIQKNVENITQFSLIYRSASAVRRTPIECCTSFDADGKPDQRIVSVDIVSLCQDICDAALKYYLENKDKFSFDYRIVSTTDSVAKAFGYDNTMKV